MTRDRVFVIGASAGGIDVLRTLAAAMPMDFPSPMLVVLHVGAHPSILPRLLATAGPLPAVHAQHGDRIEAGRIYVAPPDRHLMVEGGHTVLSHGPKENHSRPAIDPLFRSAALEYRERVVGVILSGTGQDGTAGLQSIKGAGGHAVVQEPSTAQSPGMPASALRYAKVDRTLSPPEIAPYLVELARTPAAHRGEALERDRIEHALFLSRGEPVELLRALGRPSPYVCPDCQGGLWEVTGVTPKRYRCHTGHGYTLESLQSAQAERADDTLFASFRALQEEAMLLRELAAVSRAENDAAHADRLEDVARGISRHAEELRALVERSGP